MLRPHLRTFLAVCETGSFNKAANTLFITPSAVLQQIQTLEKELGVTLFSRNKKGVSLTPEGKEGRLIFPHPVEKDHPVKVRMRMDGGGYLHLEAVDAIDPNVKMAFDVPFKGVMSAEELAKRIDLRGAAEFPATASELEISGDLAKSLAPDAPEREKLAFTAVGGNPVDGSSPVLLIGDSHTLVFSTGGDMLAEHGGLAERLAALLKTPIDRIGVKGSAATAVRIDLYRKAVKNPEWLRNKKYVIYCFSCREFTESASGWVKVPVAKK